jgi:ribosomal protein S18
MNTLTQSKPIATSYKPVKNLLSEGSTNTKTAKNEISTFILYLAPSNIIGTHNLCPMASDGCKKACLYSAGRGKFSNVQHSRINKAKFWAYDREAFYIQLANELMNIFDKSLKTGQKYAIRLNGTSDIDHLHLLKKYSGIDFLDPFYSSLLFYDYTKNINHIKKYINTSYKITFSRSEINDDQVNHVLNSGGNVAVVFKQLPETYKGYPVINGDLTDLRYFDPKNVVIGLIAKGEAKKDKSNFVI